MLQRNSVVPTVAVGVERAVAAAKEAVEKAGKVIRQSSGQQESAQAATEPDVAAELEPGLELEPKPETEPEPEPELEPDGVASAAAMNAAVERSGRILTFHTPSRAP